MSRYTLGLDFGSLSARAILADMENGRIIGEKAMDYPHGILNGPLGWEKDEREWVLQCPGDFEQVMCYITRQLLEDTKVLPGQVAGIGVDFTSSAVIPVKNNRPMSEDERFALRPHAWTKMWKYHGARGQAERFTRICREKNAPYPGWYGGNISSECLMAKVLQIYDEDREVYDEADYFVEAADYITGLLTGSPVFGASFAQAKALWNKETGYPERELLEAFDPGLSHLPRKLAGYFKESKFVFPGKKAGTLCKNMAEKLGLEEGTAVSAPQMDAYAAVPGLGITEPGTMLLMAGTSTAVILLDNYNISDKRESQIHHNIKGVTASLPDTCYEGIWTYATGQSSVGDCFQWFMDNCVPESYSQAAKENNQNLHSYFTDLASKMKPEQTGLMALDWWNGSKAYPNSPLKGMILGLNLETKPEHIYRTLLEATAFGLRTIADSFESQNVLTHRIVACGGIAVKNPFLMQMYADVLGRPVEVSSCTQAAALGAAIYGAAAAEGEDVMCTAKRMGAKEIKIYVPDKERNLSYERMYKEYKELSRYFIEEGNRIMAYLSGVR